MPSRDVHEMLGRRAAELVGLPPDYLDGFLEGITEPDVKEDREVYIKSRGDKVYRRERRVRHHQVLPRYLLNYYYNLACYYRARGDFDKAGRALGRAAHYLQDWALDTKDNVEIHDRAERKMDILIEEVPKLCERVKVRRSSDPAEALCMGFFKTVELLEQFLHEPSIDPETARREYRRARIIKWGLGAFLLGVSTFAIYTQWTVIGAFTLAVTAILASWTPKSYIKAMKAGIVKLRPSGYKTPM